MSATLRTEQLYPHPPARLWRALTDPEQLSRWLMPTNFRPEVGAAFHFDTGSWGLTQCVVLALEPEKRLQISWKNPPLDTVVTWTLVPEEGGTRLILEHSGFDLEDPRQRFAYEGMRGGWGGPIAARLQALLVQD